MHRGQRKQPKLERAFAILGVLGSLCSIAGLALFVPWKFLLWGAGLSCGLLIAWALFWSTRKHREKLRDELLASRLAQITSYYATADDVDKVWDFLFDVYERCADHVVNRESLRDFITVNSRTAKIFVKDNAMVGALIIFAINEEAVRRLLAETITSAQQLNRRYAARQRPRGLYITNVCGRTPIAKEKAKREMLVDLANSVNDGHGAVQFLFGRRANKDGARLLRDTGFEKINEAGPDLQVWKKFVGARVGEGVDLGQDLE